MNTKNLIILFVICFLFGCKEPEKEVVCLKLYMVIKSGVIDYEIIKCR